MAPPFGAMEGLSVGFSVTAVTEPGMQHHALSACDYELEEINLVLGHFTCDLAEASQDTGSCCIEDTGLRAYIEYCRPPTPFRQDGS